MYQAMSAGMWPPGVKFLPSSPMEFIWNIMPCSGVLVQGGIEKVERVLWRWTLVPMRRYKAAGLSFHDQEEAKD